MTEEKLRKRRREDIETKVVGLIEYCESEYILSS